MNKDSYADVLLRFDKESLMRINTFLGLPRHTPKHKKELVQNIADYVRNNIKWCLYHLPMADRHFLREMVKAMPNPRVNEGAYADYLIIEDLGWVDFAERTDIRLSEDEEPEYVLIGNPEIIEAVAAALPEVDRDLADRDVVERTVNGLLNLYGFLSYGDLIKYTVKMLNGKFSRVKVIDLLMDYAMINEYVDEAMIAYDNHDERALDEELISSRYQESEAFFDDPAIDYYVEHKPFSLEQVLAAGDIIPVIPSAHWDNLVDVLCNTLRLRRRDAIMRRHNLWQAINDTDLKQPSMMLNSVLCGHKPKLNSFNRLQELLEAIVNFSNTCPRWLFGGYTPEDRMSRQIQEASTRASASGAPAPSVADIPLPDNVFNMMANLQMTRPDAPCPCGSGKKYGECCGNN